MEEKQFIKELEELGFKNLEYKIDIYYYIDNGKVILDWESMNTTNQNIITEISEILNE
tara:strand:- start:949 stop:1122 length:174 start_codon:yes stop_codon:yes gene_type:complete